MYVYIQTIKNIKILSLLSTGLDKSESLTSRDRINLPPARPMSKWVRWANPAGVAAISPCGNMKLRILSFEPEDTPENLPYLGVSLEGIISSSHQDQLRLKLRKRTDYVRTLAFIEHHPSVLPLTPKFPGSPRPQRQLASGCAGRQQCSQCPASPPADTETCYDNQSPFLSLWEGSTRLTLHWKTLTWFQGTLMVYPWPWPKPTVDQLEALRWGQNRPCSYRWMEK